MIPRLLSALVLLPLCFALRAPVVHSSTPLAVTDLRIARQGPATGVTAVLTWTHNDASAASYEVWRASSPHATAGAANTARLAQVTPGGVGSPASYTDWSSSLNNIYVHSTYWVRGVTASGVLLPESNRAGEFDFKTGEVAYQAHGFGFGPYMAGQAPGTYLSEDQLRRRMGRIALHTRWIRTFGMSDGQDRAGAIAREMGLKTALGAWIGEDAAANQAEVNALIARVQAGEADIAVVGGEALYRRDVSPEELIIFINQVKAAAPPGVLVTTNEIWDVLIEQTAVIDAVDLLLVNYYPYWLGIPLDKALAATDDWYARTVAKAKGKPVWVGESGWSSCGNPQYRAVASIPNAATHFLNFVSWARSKDIPYFYFEAFDEGWKATPALPQEGCFGVWDADGNLVPEMQPVFDDDTMADNWAGEPMIDFIYVPPVGSVDNLIGQTWHADPAGHNVAVYIRVGGGWWNKPTFAQPLTSISTNGRWITDITTGGNDPQATEIAAYLVPIGYTPPQVSGWGALPAELDENAVASVIVER